MVYPTRPSSGFYVVPRAIKKIIKSCPDRCVFDQLLDWCCFETRQIHTTERELAETLAVPKTTIHRVLARIASLRLIKIEASKQTGLTVTIISDECFPRKKADHERTTNGPRSEPPVNPKLVIIDNDKSEQTTVVGITKKITNGPRTDHPSILEKERKKKEEIQITDPPTASRAIALVDHETESLAEEWLEHSRTKRRQLDKSWTKDSYVKAIEKTCKYMGWKARTLTFCFRLKKDDDAFWGAMLVTPTTLLNKWKTGRKIELLEEQCKGDRRFEHARGLQKTSDNLAGMQDYLAEGEN